MQNFLDNYIEGHEYEKVLIPINMRDDSVLAIGKGNPEWNFSAPHRAGRLMSRTAARAQLNMEEYRPPTLPPQARLSWRTYSIFHDRARKGSVCGSDRRAASLPKAHPCPDIQWLLRGSCAWGSLIGFPYRHWLPAYW
ncbi:MAG: RtcB family protein [Methanomethylovorans sp.]|nr:RtcB family protein [Methanomethylovorans sp.]